MRAPSAIGEATEPRLITCAKVYCGATFFYVPARLYPTLCLDHAHELERQLGPPNPATSVD